MVYYPRLLNLEKLLDKKSHFLLGPRSTGKSTLIRKYLETKKADIQVVDLLDNTLLSKFIKNPSYLREIASASIIIIDEVQKFPEILNEVHWLIENKKTTFLLTGSSARKLKKEGTNLLGGRAWQANLYPLISQEITDFDLIKYLNIGGLPHVYNSKYPQDELEAYIGLYLKEEIQNEALTRNISSFAEFLDLAALSNGEEINFQNFASDCGVNANTIKNYFQILKDTLIQFEVPAFTSTKKRKAITRSKYYFFDIGVCNVLARKGEIKNGSEAFGKAFEHFIASEIHAYLSYSKNKNTLSYWRSTSQFEVDLILGKSVAIEIKASSNIQDKHLKGLRALKEENIIEKFIVVSQEPLKRELNDSITIYPWGQFIEELWQGKIS